MAECVVTPGRFPAPFIVGMPRSGTTLLRLMMDAHPQLAIPVETHFIIDLLSHHQAFRKIQRALRRTPLHHRLTGVLQVVQAYLPVRPRLDAELFLKKVTQGEFFIDFHVDEPQLREGIRRLNPFSTAEALRFFYGMYAARFAKERWGDKTPHYLLYMAPIQALLPEARFIHIIRDGRDVALSLRGKWFGPQSVTAAAQTWRQRITVARHQSKRLRHYMEVRFEDLVVNTEAELRRICDFVDLPWEPCMLRYHEHAAERLDEMQQVGRRVTREDRLSISKLTSQPPMKSRIGRWKQEMTQAERDTFKRLAGRMLANLGYE